MDALWHWVNRTLMYEKQNVAKACKSGIITKWGKCVWYAPARDNPPLV